MSREIERKFIVNEHFPVNPDWTYRNSIYYSSNNITQGYFKEGDVRVRILNEWTYPKALLTIKSERNGSSRYEFEYEVPVKMLII